MKPQVVVSLPDGQQHLVEADVFGIAERVTKGDPTVGWEGDPTMGLFLNPHSLLFEVIGLDAHRNPYIAHSSRTCDERILKALAEGHWKRARAQVGLMIKAAEKRRADTMKAQDEHRAEIASKMAHALGKAFFRHDFVSMSGPRFEDSKKDET